MSWLAVQTPQAGARRIGNAAVPTTLPCGSILTELHIADLEDQPATLLRLDARRGFGWALLMTLLPEGRLFLRIVAGGRRLTLVLRLAPEDRIAPRLRITLGWEAAEGDRPPRTILTAESLSTGRLCQSETAAALIPPGAALRNLIAAAGVTRDTRLGWIAVADHCHRPGPCPGIARGTAIDTPAGPRPVEALQPGDLVMSFDHGPVPVRWAGAVTLPAQGSFRPLRLRAPYYGRRRDLVVMPGQRILCSGADVEYLIGAEDALIEARHLVNGDTALEEEAAQGVTEWFGLLFDRHELIRAEGCLVESLYAGGLALRPELAATTILAPLAQAGQLPLHQRPVRADLSDYESRGLQFKRMNARAPLIA